MTATIDKFQGPSRPNLLDVLTKALLAGAIPAARVPRARAAVAAFARLLQRPASELPAHQAFIIQQMRRLRRQPTGLSPKTLSNTRSELLHLVKVVCGRGPRSAFTMSEPWGRFRIALAGSPAWWSLSRFAAFSSRQNVTPSAVDDAHLGRFREALEQSGEVADAIGHIRRVIRIWNKVAADHPILPIRSLTLISQRRSRWTLPETAFPHCFRADVEAWFLRLKSDDPFSPRPCRALRPSTLRTRRHQIFKAASALVLSGRSVEGVHTLADLVSIPAFQDLLRYLLERQNRKSTEALHGLAGALLALARHHVGVDKETEGRLARIVKHLHVEAAGFRTKTRTRLMAFEDDRRVSALLHLPARLFAEAKACRAGRRRQQLCQVALAIEILTFAPMRVGNLVSLRLGASLRRVAQGHESYWLISIPAHEVKNRTELTFELPSGDLIQTAIALYDQPDGWLFPGRGSRPKAASLLSMQIKRTIESRLGLPFHTHMFRALAGYLHLKENPNGFEAVKAILGNRDDDVIRKNYSFLAERSLIANAQAAIGKTRARLVPPRKAKRKVV
jgi:hypothetical protein